MNASSPVFAVSPESAAFARYERLLLRLHELIAAGQGDTDDADALREEMDSAWNQLDGPRRAILGGLSADLYMLSGKELRLPAPEGQPASELDLSRAHLYARGAWELFLDLMRRGATTLDPAFVSFGRARAYDAIGLKAAAARFYDHAAELNPKDNYKALALELYKEAGELDVAVPRARDAIDNANAGAGLLVTAAGVLFASTRDVPERAARRTYEQIHAVIDRALQQPSVDRDVQVSGLILKGLAHESLGDLESAANAYDLAEQLKPLSPVVRQAKAWLHEQMGRPRHGETDGSDILRERRLVLAERAQLELATAA